ncbi:MAG: DUF3592 domain-containing protein [Verrucomicrobiota bacterium]
MNTDKVPECGRLRPQQSSKGDPSAKFRRAPTDGLAAPKDGRTPSQDFFRQGIPARIESRHETRGTAKEGGGLLLGRLSMPIFFQIISGIFALGAVGLASRNLRRLFTWGSASGMVHRVEEVSGRRGRRLYRPAFKFLTREGREVSVCSEMASSHFVYRVGEPVRVLYDVRDPERAEIASFMRLWFPVVVLLFLAGAFFLAGR